MEYNKKRNSKKINEILNNGDIDYMFNIYYSKVGEEEKAITLFDFCSREVLDNSLESAISLNEEQRIGYLRRLIGVYNYYDRRGYFKNNNTRKATVQVTEKVSETKNLKEEKKSALERNIPAAEIEERIQKLIKVNEIIKSNNSDFIKAEELLKIYKNSYDFKKQFTRFITWGKNDHKIDPIRPILDNFDILLNEFIRLEQEDIIGKIKYIERVKDYLYNYKYAKFIINEYINDKSSYETHSFLAVRGIDEEIFKFCINTIEELDVDLYNKYLKVKEKNKKLCYAKIVRNVKELVEGIKTGFMPDGEEFSELVFITKVPFKKNHDRMDKLISLVKKEKRKDGQLVINYLIENKLQYKDSFTKFNKEELYKVKVILNGVELTDYDKTNILNYMEINNIPSVSRAYYIVRKKYLNSEITPDMCDIKKSNKYKCKTLIP